MGRGKPATPINKEAFFKAVEEAEKDGSCGTRKTLFESVAKIYNTQNPDEKEINPNHANTRILKTWGIKDLLTGHVLLDNGYELKTNKGNPGRQAGSGAPAGRKGANVDKDLLFKAIKEAEKNGRLGNRTKLFAASADQYNLLAKAAAQLKADAEGTEPEFEKEINGNTVKTRIIAQGWGNCVDDSIHLGEGEDAYEVLTPKGQRGIKRSTPILSDEDRENADAEDAEDNFTPKEVVVVDQVGDSGLPLWQEVFLKMKAEAEGLNAEDYLEQTVSG
jgi:hypothetical protein